MTRLAVVEEVDDFSEAVVESRFAGVGPLWDAHEEFGGMLFIYQRFAVLENEQVVLLGGLDDDFREEVKGGFADNLLPLP